MEHFLKSLILIILILASSFQANATWLGERRINDPFVGYLQTNSLTTGGQTDADSAPTYAIYEDETATPILTGTASTLNAGSTDGWYSVDVTLSAANGFEVNKNYAIRWLAVMGGVSVSKKDEFVVRKNLLSELLADFTTPGTIGFALGQLYGGSIGGYGTATGTGLNNTLIDDTRIETADDFAVGNRIVIISGDRINESSLILGYNATTKTFLLNKELSSATESGDDYIIMTDHDAFENVVDKSAEIIGMLEDIADDILVGGGGGGGASSVGVSIP